MTTLTTEKPKTEQLSRMESYPLNGASSERAEGKGPRSASQTARKTGTWYDRYAEYKLQTGYWNLFRI